MQQPAVVLALSTPAVSAPPSPAGRIHHLKQAPELDHTDCDGLVIKLFHQAI